MIKNKNPLYFWVILICFFGGILMAQQYLRKQGSDLIPGAGGDFTLMSDSGAVSLSDFKGKAVAIYFGYMSCPDICPTSLWNLSSALKLLTAEQADQVQGIFISVDPDRDSLYALNLFVKGFAENFVGLTSSMQEINKVTRQYGVIHEKVSLEDSAMGYVIDHTSVIYLIDRQGVLQYFVPHNTDPGAIRDDLLKLITPA